MNDLKLTQQQIDKIEELKNVLQIEPVGNGYIDMICPMENAERFIDETEKMGLRIYGLTWWCKVTKFHKPCGMGGPKSKYGNYWYSEVCSLGDVITFDSNADVREFLTEYYPKSKEYKKCHNPGFWLEYCEPYKVTVVQKETVGIDIVCSGSNK